MRLRNLLMIRAAKVGGLNRLSVYWFISLLVKPFLLILAPTIGWQCRIPTSDFRPPTFKLFLYAGSYHGRNDRVRRKSRSIVLGRLCRLLRPARTKDHEG